MEFEFVSKPWDGKRESLPIGSVAYYIKKDWRRNANPYYVWWGIVSDHLPGSIVLDLYDYRDNRLIDGVPITEVVTPSKWRKLPKGWGYDTELFHVTYSKTPEYMKSITIDNPDGILQCIQNGDLIPVAKRNYGHLEDEIDKNRGWRLVRKYPYGEHHPTYISIPWHEVYAIYAEAKAVIDNRTAALYEIAEMTDEEWAVREIDCVLDRWKALRHIDEEEVQQVRNFLLSQDKLDKIEVRLGQGGPEWKYEDKKRWLNINV